MNSEELISQSDSQGDMFYEKQSPQIDPDDKEQAENRKADVWIEEKQIQKRPQDDKELGSQKNLQMPSQRLNKLYYAQKQRNQDQQNIRAGWVRQKEQDLILLLKQIHSKEQKEIIGKINELSGQSKQIINQLGNIENEIDKYHNQIDTWIDKIETIQGQYAEKIRNVEHSFKKKALNISKLKDFLNIQRPRRR